MGYYRIDISASVGGEAKNEPAITCETRESAFDKLNDLAYEWRERLNDPMMRNVGGRCELFLQKTGTITGLDGGNIIRTVRIDRPIHSPSARVVVWDDNDTIVSDSWKQ